MNVFEIVKENVTARQAAEAYGLKVGRTGMACCPFHSDMSPSMKLDERYYCFGCGATGDAVDLTAKLFGIGLREAAVKLAEDFGLNYDSRQKPSVRPRIREPTPEQKYQKEENHCYKVLTDYFHLLREWERNTLLNSRMRNGILCLQKHCIRRTISNICLIFFCMVHWRNEKHLWQNRERRC